jgi:hypothetical protein
MPYVTGSTSQGDSGLPEVQDVFKATNVYANGKLVALWEEPGASSAFANVAADPAVSIAPVAQANANASTDGYIANPAASYNAGAEAAGVKGNYNPPPEDAGDAPEQPANSSAAAGDIIPFLNKILEEAKRGMWRESGQGGRPSNPNITNIWKNLGIGPGGCWNTDQTAWCAGFVNFALKNSGYKYYQCAGARQTAAKLAPVAVKDAQPGDVVLWPFSHVNFIYTRQGNKVTFCGGNQTPSSGKNNNPSDGDVTISWPSGYDLGKGGIQVFRPSR